MNDILTLNIMPNLDKTGPNGKGPITGRGMGNCNSDSPNNQRLGRGFFGRFFGRGRGFGAGRGMGRGRGFWAGRDIQSSIDQK